MDEGTVGASVTLNETGMAEVVLRIADEDGGLSATLLGTGGSVMAARPISLDVLPDDPGITEAYGESLTRSVLDGPIGEALGEIEPARVRLIVPAARPDLLALRWERLLGPGAPPRVPLAARPATPFSRALFPDSTERARDPLSRWPLRVVVAISNPVDISERYGLPAIDVEVEQRELERAMRPLRGLVEATTIDAPVSLDRILEALEGETHVFHFLGHGFVNRKTGEAVLYLEDGAGRKTQPVPDREWMQRLGAMSRVPHLVLLSACQSAAATNRGALVGMAPAVIAAGAGATIAMADRVEIGWAREFNFHFYRRVATHGEIDRAANEARSYLLDAPGWAWSIPTAFLERGAERIFAAPPEPLEAKAAEPEETLIVIAEFAGKGHEEQFFEEELQIQLQQEIAGAGLHGVRVAWLANTTIQPGSASEAEAHRLAARYGAALVIWGRYDESGLRAFFTFTESLFAYRDPAAPQTTTVREVFGPDRDFVAVVNRHLPRHVEYFVFLILAYLRYWSNDKEGALAALNRAIGATAELSGPPPEGLAHAHFYRANVHAAFRQDRPAAIADYRRALELDARLGAAAFNLGQALRTLGNTRRAKSDRAAAEEAYRQAVDAYDLAVSIDPDDAAAYEGRGLARFALAESDEAAGDLRAALEREPAAETYNRLSAALDAQDRLAEAREAMDQAIIRAPWACHYRFNRWRILVRMNETAAAQEDAREYIRLCPKGAERERLGRWLDAVTKG